MQLGLKDQEQAEGDEEAAADAASSDSEKQGEKRAAPKRNRGHLPKHLPRIERVIEPEETACPCCDGQMHVPISLKHGARTRASNSTSSPPSSK